jgi:hypothetical protein
MTVRRQMEIPRPLTETDGPPEGDPDGVRRPAEEGDFGTGWQDGRPVGGDVGELVGGTGRSSSWRRCRGIRLRTRPEGWFVHPLAAMSGTGRSQLAAKSVDWSAKSTVGLVGPESGWPRGDRELVGPVMAATSGGPVGDVDGGLVGPLGAATSGDRSATMPGGPCRTGGGESGTGRRSRRWTGRSTGWPFRTTGNRSVQEAGGDVGGSVGGLSVAGRGPRWHQRRGDWSEHLDGGLVGPICWRRSRPGRRSRRRSGRPRGREDRDGWGTAILTARGRCGRPDPDGVP